MPLSWTLYIAISHVKKMVLRHYILSLHKAIKLLFYKILSFVLFEIVDVVYCKYLDVSADVEDVKIYKDFCTLPDIFKCILKIVKSTSYIPAKIKEKIKVGFIILFKEGYNQLILSFYAIFFFCIE